MSESWLLRIKCDECGKYMTGEEIEIRSRAYRPPWVRIRLDMYGNTADACSTDCEMKYLRRIEKAMNE